MSFKRKSIILVLNICIKFIVSFVACATILAESAKARVDICDSIENRNAEEWARETGCQTPEVMPFSPLKNVYKLKFQSTCYGGSIDHEEVEAEDSEAVAVQPPKNTFHRCTSTAEHHTKAGKMLHRHGSVPTMQVSTASTSSSVRCTESVQIALPNIERSFSPKVHN